MGAPFSTYHQVPYNQLQNQSYTQNQEYNNNSFMDKQNNQTSHSDTVALIEKLQQLLLAHKNPAHQVNKVKVMTPQPGTMWDLKAATELPTRQEDQLERLTAGSIQEVMPTITNPECSPTTQGEIEQSPHNGHQRANTTHISGQNTANKVTHKPPRGANSKYSKHKGPQRSAQFGQQTSMDRKDRGTPRA